MNVKGVSSLTSLMIVIPTQTQTKTHRYDTD